ncbi:hypothetical protein AGLY_012049 [Aphis glycines]|uniref:DDE Tnp4 domain-containing protein n=1 Tax=Aphis glycines TaxID=307491 RepID=A0A6G0TB44_APHGL|nr:hypothetical protein AGLY_012049 [Aphis glycines]
MPLTTEQRKILLSKSLAVKHFILNKKRKRNPVHSIYKDRFELGEFHHLYTQLRADNLFYSYTRMTTSTFDYIKKAIEPELPISVEERLLITLRISKTAVTSIVIEVCKAIWKILKEKHKPTPTIANFENIAQDIDGKHIRIKCPINSDSIFFNYKLFFSIVLLGVADANYKFIMIDVGAYRKDSDADVLENLNILKRLENKTLKLPYPKKLPNSYVTGPYIFIADEAFPLRTYLILSRARITIECAFETKVENADHAKAICMLHNVIIDLEKINVTENYNIHSDYSKQLISTQGNRNDPNQLEDTDNLLEQNNENEDINNLTFPTLPPRVPKGLVPFEKLDLPTRHLEILNWFVDNNVASIAVSGNGLTSEAAI